MSIVIIGKAETIKIERLIAFASEHPVRWKDIEHIVTRIPQGTTVLSLADREKVGGQRIERAPHEHLMLGNVRVAYSHEEQPAGMFRHLSASVRKPGKLPSPQAVEMICDAFHFTSFPPTVGRVWIEEFQPGHNAINVVELIVTAPAGNA